MSNEQQQAMQSGIQRWFVGREVGGALVVLLALVAIMYATRLTLLQIPGYIVMIGFDYVDNVYLSLNNTVVFFVLFFIYCYLLAILLAALYRGSRAIR